MGDSMLSGRFHSRVRRCRRCRNDFSRQNCLSYILDIWDKENLGLAKCTKLGGYISLVMLITWSDFEGILLDTCFLSNFLLKHFIGHISGMVGPIDMERKGGASIEYWVNYVTLTFDLTHDLDLIIFFKVKFQNSCISGIVIWLMCNKKKANQLDTGLTVWSCPLTTPMTLIL